MGAVILAAGRGERLAGYAAPYMKPLLIVNGQPLIVQQMRNAMEVTDNITLVLAPENARFMIDLIQGAMQLDWMNIEVVVQPWPGTSVTDALRRGLWHQGGPCVVLMGDNVVPPLTVREMWDSVSRFHRCDVLVATQEMSWKDAERFTYRSAGIWWEKEVAAAADATEDLAEVWIGPLIIDSPADFLEAMGDSNSIGTSFNRAGDVRTFSAKCVDVGVPEEIK
jgi:GTP:adenosylcobinamide-phosphate guanylyltransferase